MGNGGKPLACPECSAAVPAEAKTCPNCGAAIRDISQTLTSGFTSIMPEPDWERFAPGNVFANRYTIIEEIGHGGMGRVFKAIDRSLGITVAIKIIRPEHASNPRVVALFKQETVLARSISSENVVRVHDLGEAENTKYISMDFVEGQNLRDLIFSSGSLTISTAIKFGQQICSGLAAAHKQSIIHRDLKPSNIMIDRTGRVRVMDFGLAMTIARKDGKGVRTIVGTPEYLSPEQARGDDVDRRTDIYSLGLILYEMVTGHPVFEAESLTGYIQKHCEVIPEPPSRRNQLVPAALDAVILRCLKKDRSERYQTVEEVCQALDRVIAPEARQRRTARSRLLRVLGGVAACVLIALIIRRVFFPPPKPRGPSILKSVAVMSFENITGESSPENWTAATQYLLHIDLEMSRFLRVITRERLRDCLNELHINDTGVYAQADLDRIASRENIDIFVLGACLTSGTGCRIDIRLLDARLREPLNSHSFNAAAFVEIQDRCDDISLWVKDELALIKGGQAKDYDRELKSYTSKSSEALEHFFRGLELYEKRDIKKSTEAYLMALAADSDFALAHARLAMNFTYEGKSAEAKSHLLKAMSLRNKLTARERLLIEGDYYNLYENDYAGAIRKYESLLRDYPNDEMALEHQGAIYRIIEEWEKAQRCFERVRAINPRSRIVVRNLSFIAEARGEYEKAERLLRDNKDVYSSSEEFQRDLARCLLCRGRPDQAWRELEKARCSDAPSLACLLLHGHIQLTMGNYKDAETTYRRVAEKGWTDIDRLEEHYWLGQLYLLRGQFENCARELEEGLKTASEGGLLYEEWNFLWLRSYLYLLQGDFVEAYGTAVKARQKAVEADSRKEEVETLGLMGLCQVELGQVSNARRTVLTMEQIINKMGYPKLLRCCFYLQGKIAGVGKSGDEAAGAFRKAMETLPRQHSEYLDRQAFYAEGLASIMSRKGDLESARGQYEKIVSLTTGRLTAGDAYAKSLFQLGRIYQEKEDPATAREFFRKYLAARGEADPGLDEVEEARKRLASIS